MFRIDDSPWIKGRAQRFESIFQKYEIGRSKQYGAGEIVYSQYEIGDTCYYVKKGRVKVYLIQGDDAGFGSEKILSIHEAGSFFGEASAIDSQPRPCDAVTMMKSELIVLNQREIIRLMQLDSETGLAILQSLTRKIRMLSYQIADMAFSDAEKRIVHILLKLALDFGVNTEKGLDLSVHFSDQELAGIVGVCRVTVTKALNNLKRKGWIEKNYRSIRICAPMELCKYLYDDNSQIFGAMLKTVNG
ncbi:MAG: Crp/Fnr family transcriptional regulator [Gracilibacteraceae bacterium]|nr:Crp/Fnr family transcriptional regulator [Gracilibacteraceae bacterium]